MKYFFVLNIRVSLKISIFFHSDVKIHKSIESFDSVDKKFVALIVFEVIFGFCSNYIPSNRYLKNIRMKFSSQKRENAKTRNAKTVFAFLTSFLSFKKSNLKIATS
jgi:hypothetical protein